MIVIRCAQRPSRALDCRRAFTESRDFLTRAKRQMGGSHLLEVIAIAVARRGISCRPRWVRPRAQGAQAEGASARIGPAVDFLWHISCTQVLELSHAAAVVF